MRPAVSTEYIENDEPSAKPTYRCYYPTADTMLAEVLRMVRDFDLRVPFDDLERDAGLVLAAMKRHFDHVKLRANFQFQVLSSLFFRNKGAYVVGKIINGFQEVPFALPILHNDDGKLVIDAALFGEDDLLLLFSFARAYFMVDMEIPSAYVQFLRSLMPRKPRAEFYNALGLAKQGKTLFYRDFLFHMRHSTDQFRIAPGIKGMVMLVFDLPSFPFVFKVIKDFYPPQKDTTREQIRGKYQLVKKHDRVGRMADTLEFSEVGFPRERFTDELIAEIQKFAPSQLEISDRNGDGTIEVMLKHVLHRAAHDPAQHLPAGSLRCLRRPTTGAQIAADTRVVEYGNAIKDLVAANIFPGDMLWKNFGITRHGKVVFYDYDEIEYITDCNFRRVPEPRNEEDEMSGEVWYSVAQARCVSRNLRPVPARQPGGARGLHAAPRRSAGRRVLAVAQGTHRRRPCVRCFPLRARPAFPVARARLKPFVHPSTRRFMTTCPKTPSSSSAPPAPPWARSRATSPASRPTTWVAPPSRPPSQRSGVSPDQVDEVLFGNCLMAGQGQAPARQAALKGGLPKSAGAVTLVQDVRLGHEGHHAGARHARSPAAPP